MVCPHLLIVAVLHKNMSRVARLRPAEEARDELSSRFPIQLESMAIGKQLAVNQPQKGERRAVWGVGCGVWEKIPFLDRAARFIATHVALCAWTTRHPRIFFSPRDARKSKDRNVAAWRTGRRHM